jgi:hypothetical protein
MSNRVLIWQAEFVDEDELSEDDDAEITNEEGDTVRVKVPNSQKIIHTNFGSFIANNPNNPYVSRDVFVGHTNFSLTETHARELAAIDGIEGLRILTRYSFTIAVGVAFMTDDVLSEVEKVLDIEQIDIEQIRTEVAMEDNKDLIAEVVADITEKLFFAYIFPNGKKLVEQYKTLDEMEERRLFFSALENLSDGLLISSDKV